LWGPREYDGSVVILLGVSLEDAKKSCGRVETRVRVEHPYSMPYERFNILVCRDMKKPLKELWPEIKNWR
jgi:hypothetical protein